MAPVVQVGQWTLTHHVPAQARHMERDKELKPSTGPPNSTRCNSNQSSDWRVRVLIHGCSTVYRTWLWPIEGWTQDLLQVSYDVWQQDIGGRSCRVWTGATVDQTRSSRSHRCLIQLGSGGICRRGRHQSPSSCSSRHSWAVFVVCQSEMSQWETTNIGDRGCCWWMVHVQWSNSPKVSPKEQCMLTRYPMLFTSLVNVVADQCIYCIFIHISHPYLRSKDKWQHWKSLIKSTSTAHISCSFCCIESADVPLCVVQSA